MHFSTFLKIAAKYTMLAPQQMPELEPAKLALSVVHNIAKVGATQHFTAQADFDREGYFERMRHSEQAQ